ncbi:hypothetical protein SDC9_87296 [bioreactor metagenome]|uniref:Uncharacterized protein n=1 Tax=bioreactor metagenome TaxID=1076179 RepID=A0A644ZID3_9ZZZZ
MAKLDEKSTDNPKFMQKELKNRNIYFSSIANCNVWYNLKRSTFKTESLRSALGKKIKNPLIIAEYQGS